METGVAGAFYGLVAGSRALYPVESYIGEAANVPVAQRLAGVYRVTAVKAVQRERAGGTFDTLQFKGCEVGVST